MFDTVICEYALPLPDFSEEETADMTKVIEETAWDEIEFQTKSFDSNMLTYTISEDGQIYEQQIEREWVTDETNPIGATLEERSMGIERIDHTGNVCFYHLITGEEHDYWLEFSFLFWKGEVKEAKLLEYKKEGNEERKKIQETWSDQLQVFNKRKSSWWFPLYKFYRLSLGFVLAVFRKVLEWTMRALFKIERWMP